MQISGRAVKALAIGIVLVLIPISVNAAQKVNTGATCKVLNQKVSNQNKIYTCIKSGRKLVWNQGGTVVIHLPSPTPTLVPTPSPTPTPTLVPTPSPTPTLVPTPTQTELLSTLDALFGKFDVIPSIAFSVLVKNAAQVPSSTDNFNMIVGPNSVLPNSKVSASLKVGRAIWANFKQPSKVNVIYFGFSDVDWAQQMFSSFIPQINKDLASSMCLSVYQCADARSLGVANGEGLFAVALSSNNGADVYHTSGGVDIHEYTHVVQSYLALGNSVAPSWWQEGQAMFTSLAASSPNFSDYLSQRSWLRTSFIDYPKVDVTASSIASYLLQHQTWESPTGYPPGAAEAGYGYGIGSLFVEALTAIKGLDPSMQVWKNMGSGMSFAEAFKSSYGFSFTDAVQAIAPLISAESQNVN